MRLPLALAGLAGVAITQPIFQLLGNQASFFITHRLDRLDLLVFVLSLALLLPVFLVVATRAAGVLGARFRALAALLILGMLASLSFLALLRSVDDPLPAGWAIALAAAAGLVSCGVWTKSGTFGDGVALLATIMPLAAGLFVWQTASAGLWASSSTVPTPPRLTATSLPPPARPASPHPIVWVVFDELPLASLLDDAGRIDAELYPNFAALGTTATWFRNATTVWSLTEQSITSMLTGRLADPERAPTRALYPDNLFTWLRESHAVHATELVTRLAGATVRESGEPPPSRGKRWRALAFDVALIYVHRVLPPTLAADLPPVDTRWGHFGEPRAAATVERFWLVAMGDGRGRRFADFLSRIQPSSPPMFLFEHVMLPHLPFRFLPSRRVYGGRSVYQPPRRAWLEDEQYTLEVYKRHLLQVGFVDRLVGDLVGRLHETGLFDRSLLIITSDHGASYWPGEDRRVPGATAHPDDILRIPLFIKAPGQTIGSTRDDNVQTIDLAATVAEILAAELPWSTTGRSTRDAAVPRPARKTLCGPQAGCTSIDGELALDRATLRRKMVLFDPARGDERWTDQGPYRALIGQPAAGQASAPAPSCDAILDQLPELRGHDPMRAYAPAQWTGQLRCQSTLPAETSLALASRGRVRATTELREVDGELLFSVFVGDHALVPGDNEPAVYLIEDGPGGLALAPVPIHDQDIRRPRAPSEFGAKIP